MSGQELFDRLRPGMVQELGEHTFQADEIIAFATKFDPQRFHLSQEGAQNSHFGDLCASGWQTASVWMRKNVENRMAGFMEQSGYMGPEPKLGASPGLRKLKWLLPVYVGDTISYRTTLLDKRLHPRSSGWALLSLRNEGENQRGELVLSMESTARLRLD